jgi:hypothetical protein
MSSIYFSVSGYGWWVILIILLSAAYSWFFYQSDRRKKNFSTGWLFSLLAIRFVSVLMILLLLLKPGLEWIKKIEERPIIVFIQDRSESIVNGFESTQALSDYEIGKAQFINELREDFILYPMRIGERLEQEESDSTDYNLLATNLSLIAEDIPYLFDGEQVAAVVLASDGIHNQGNQPEFAFAGFPYPLYSVGMGDPTIYPDLKINRMIGNRYAFSGNTFPLKVEVLGKEVPEATYKLSLFSGAELLVEKEIKLEGKQVFSTEDFEVVAGRPGLQKIRVVIESLEEEKNKLNNAAELLVEVLDKKQKVLLLAHSPHPDLTALKQSLESADQIEVDLRMKDNPPSDYSAYNLVILHQLPSVSDGIPTVLTTINKLQLPLILITGSRSDLGKINQMGFGALYSGIGQERENAQVILHEEFSLFQYEKAAYTLLAQYPPLTIPFARLNKLPNQQVLFYAKIRNVPTTHPVVAFYNFPDRKLGIVGGEGIWQWRLHDYRQNANHIMFNGMMNQLVQYMAVKLQKERLRIDAKPLYDEGDPLLFQAEIYNPSFEKVSGPELSLKLTDELGHEYDYLFGIKEDDYFLNAGQLPAGNYSFLAETRFNDETLSKKGQFTILSKDIETADLQANHSLLGKLSQENGGKFFLPKDFQLLANEIKESHSQKIIIREDQTKTDFIELKWILILLLILFAVEWFSRKYHGAY